MKKAFLSISFLLLALSLTSQVNPLWLRYTAISPDGKTILFTYKGDIYSVPVTGGTAFPLTLSETYEFSPVWSHDGKSIAFASDRYGNFDVYVMPSSGGEAKRLTYHSSGEIPYSFTADDKAILFSACRQDLATNAQFPISLLTELYSVPVSGGRVSQVITSPALNVNVNPSGDKLIYDNLKGYENLWRKHHTSAITHDIILYDLKTKKFTQLTQFPGEDRNPVFDSDGNHFYYLSEQNGSFNIFKSSLEKPSENIPLTRFSKDPVRFLSISSDNTLCFSFNGEVYTMKQGAGPEKVNISIAVDGRTALEKIVPVNENITEAKLSPSGKEFAYVFRGEIFVTSIDGGVTKRITNTPWQERSIDFSPDGRSIVYAAEKNNNWNIYTISISRKEEPYFFMSTLLREETVVATPAEEFQPAFSPDGKEVAYLENRVVLKVINLATKQSRTIMTADRNYSYVDGDQYYQWSPDGKWFLVQFGYPQRVQSPQVGLVSSDGKGEIHNLTMSGYNNFLPKWVLDGKEMIWGSDREGTRMQSGDLISGNVYAMFFSRASLDRFKLTKEELSILKDQEEKEAKDKKEAEEKAKAADKKGKETVIKTSTDRDSLKKDIVIDWDNLTDRKVRLTTYTSSASDWVLSKDGEKLYYLTSFDKGNDLWVTELRTRETKLLTKLGYYNVGMELSRNGKFIFLLGDGRPYKIDLESGKSESLKTGGEMVLNQTAERNYIFDHAWRQLKEKFYVENLQGVDWDFYYNDYKKFLPFINNNYDFAEMLSEMLGELNVSHTGAGYRNYLPNQDQTSSTGMLFDYNYEGKGLRIAEVIRNGPVDKAVSKVKPGVILERIDGESVDSVDFYKLLNRRTGKLILLSFNDPATGTKWDESIKPVSLGEENELLYRRWVENRRNEVEQLSNGRIGYIHVRSMDDASMRTVFEEALGRNIGKEALIIDTRFNGGGNIHEQLSDFLSGKKYCDIIPHGQYVGSEPYDKWTKPSIVLIGESNYSDAHLFPVAYKLKNIGKTLGMPIPGTGTFVWWETQIDPTLYFGMPMGGWRTPDGKFCENNQMEPDIRVLNEPDVLATGRDQQIEAAVKELLKK
ncbi:MAG TPA: S41 family peptidase [Bacteroidales bacterium]|nr:S41 family peptidase [Bacteroidales bacterium]